MNTIDFQQIICGNGVKIVNFGYKNMLAMDDNIGVKSVKGPNLVRVVGRVFYYAGGWRRVDGKGEYVPVGEVLWRYVMAVIGEDSVDAYRPRSGRKRLEGSVKARAMRYRRAKDGESRGLGRPLKSGKWSKFKEVRDRFKESNGGK